MRIIPSRRFFVNLELTLILGLCEGVMFNIVFKLHYTTYQKAGLLMLGTAGDILRHNRHTQAAHARNAQNNRQG